MCQNGKHAGRYIGILANKIRRRRGELSNQEEFSGAQGRTLHFLLAESCTDIYQKDVEQEFCLRPSTATCLLKQLEQQGMITRVPDSRDARLKKIVVTEKALAHKKKVIEELQQLERELADGISDEDMEVFYRVVEKMLENLE